LKDKIRIAENFDNRLPDDVAGELEKGGGPLFLRPHKVRLRLDTQIALSVTTHAPRKRGLSNEADAVFWPPVSAWEASDRMAACRRVTQFGATIIVILRPHAGLPGDD
jgi:hypothetical protein